MLDQLLVKTSRITSRVPSHDVYNRLRQTTMPPTVRLPAAAGFTTQEESPIFAEAKLGYVLPRGETMARSRKWINVMTPEQPFSEAARLALRERLSAVWHFAPLAAKKSDESSEFVHGLRVASRRARAALQVFADLLPRREMQRMQKTLRQLRKAAGNARDLDVLRERLETIREEQEDGHLQAVLTQIAARRRRAQKPLVTSYRRAKRKGFNKRLRGLAKSVQWRQEQPEPTFAAAARGRLAALVDDFFAAAGADLSGIESLHKLRIHGKQLRYAMELLANAFDDSFRGDLYATFEEVQEKLGAINDHATAIATFGKWCESERDDGSRAELAELIASEERQLEQTCQEFRAWWTTARAAELAQNFAKALRVSPSPDAVETVA